MCTRRGACIFCFIFLTALLHGQDNSFSQAIPEYFDFPDSTIAFDADEFFTALKNNPIDLNAATENDLLKIPLLTPIVIAKILDYRKQAGHLFSPRELYLISDIDTSIIKSILPYVTFNKQSGTKRPNTTGKATYLDRAAYDVSFRLLNSVDASSPSLNEQVYAFKCNTDLPDNNTFGLSFNRFSRRDKKEFYSFYLSLNAVPGIEKIIIGDFHVVFGNGLLYGKYFSINKAFNPETALLQSTGFAEENVSLSSRQMMRGITAVIPVTGMFTCVPFIYSRTIPLTNDPAGKPYLDPVQLSTAASDLAIAEGNVADETTAGLIVNAMPMKHLSLSLLGSYSHYSKEFYFNNLIRNESRLASCSFSYAFSLFNFAGEIANANSAWPYRIALSVRPVESVSLLYSLRNYPAGSYTPYSQRNTNASSEIFEAGNFFALRCTLSGIALTSYFDQYATTGRPGANPLFHNTDYYLRFEKALNEQASVRCFLRTKDDESAKLSGDSQSIIESRNSYCGAALKDKLSRSISAEFSLQYHQYELPTSSVSGGFGQIIALSLHPTNQIEFQIGFCSWHTDSETSSVSFFEPGIPGIPAGGMLSGDGTRVIVACKYLIKDKLQLSGRYSFQQAAGANDNAANHADFKLSYKL